MEASLKVSLGKPGDPSAKEATNLVGGLTTQFCPSPPEVQGTIRITLLVLREAPRSHPSMVRWLQIYTPQCSGDSSVVSSNHQGTPLILRNYQGTSRLQPEMLRRLQSYNQKCSKCHVVMNQPSCILTSVLFPGNLEFYDNLLIGLLASTLTLHSIV